MAQNITLLGASYSAVPAVQLPKSGGGLASFTDVTDTTATASDVAQGKYFYTSSGERTVGTASGGGSGDLAEVNDVTFIDYDGRVLYSYTKSEFLALSAMPSNPTHTGLTSQGWNWTLEQAKTFVTANDYLCIGQVYTTADTKTHVIVDIMEYMVGNEFRIRLYTSVKGGTTVDWGDGNTTTPTANANTTTYAAHTYSIAGRYDITVYATSGTYELGYNGSNASALNSNSTQTNLTCKYVRALYIGKDCNKLHRSCIGRCSNIEAVTIPKTVTSIGDSGQGSTYLFGDSVKLKSIIIPSEGVLATLALAGGLPSLRFISVGYGSIGSSTSGSTITSEVRNLEMLTIGNVTSFSNNNQVAYNCRNLTRFAVAGSYTTIYGGYFRDSGPTKKVVIPSTVTSIADYALTSSYIEELHFKPTTPPTLANSRGMSQNWGKIYVPYSEDHSILTAYQTANNYTGYAGIMQEEPS